MLPISDTTKTFISLVDEQLKCMSTLREVFEQLVKTFEFTESECEKREAKMGEVTAIAIVCGGEVKGNDRLVLEYKATDRGVGKTLTENVHLYVLHYNGKPKPEKITLLDVRVEVPNVKVQLDVNGEVTEVDIRKVVSDVAQKVVKSVLAISTHSS